MATLGGLPLMGDPCRTYSTWSTETLRLHGGRHGSLGKSHSIGKSQSLVQLHQPVKFATVPLPPIMKAPRPKSFEDILHDAKLRVAKRAAKDRKGGTAPHLLSKYGSLPDFPRVAGRQPGFLDKLPPEDPEALTWAAATLDLIPGEDTRMRPYGSESSNPADVTAVLTKHSSVLLDPNLLAKPDSRGGGSPQRQASKRASVMPGAAKMDRSRDLSGTPKGAFARVLTLKAERAQVDPEMAELLDNIAARLEGRSDGFSPKELQRLDTAFGRFKIPGESDLYVTDIPDLLNYLGYVLTNEEQVMQVVREVTTFDYMDWDEFVIFMEQYILFEREAFRTVFDDFDEDHSGTINLKELRALTKALGFVPLRQMIEEALEIVDADGDGTLNFEEACTFLAVYQFHEGFTRFEVAELRRQFEFFSVEGSGPDYGVQVLPPQNLSDALVQVFGLQVGPFTRMMEERLLSGQGLQKSTFDKGGGEPESLRFAEFLIFARKIRQEVYETISKEHGPGTSEEFKKSDTDGSGGVSEAELRQILIQKKYTPLRSVMDEIFDDIYTGDWDPETSELDFDEFFDFLLVFEQRDGFTKREVEDLRKVYDRFDEDHSGEVSAMECAELFRYVGYRVTLEDLRDYVTAVDENGSGQLDFREFLRLMRLFREKELKKMQDVYRQFRDKDGTLKMRLLETVLQKLGHDPPYDLPPGMEHEETVDFDGLVTVADSCRSSYVAKERKKAGFSDEEIEYFKDIFWKFDLNKNGEIDNMELQGILKEFGWEPKSREQQMELMRKLDIARHLAREAGVSDVGQDGSPVVKFWSFIQLARMLRTQQDKDDERQLRELQAQLAFTEGEVEDFRQIFRSWVKRSAELEGKEHKRNDNTPETLSREMLRRLVRSLGISISPANGEKFNAKIQSLDAEERLETAELGFAGFLQLMRWILDTDFAGIAAATANARSATPQATSQSEL